MYCVDGYLLARQYKLHISGFEDWELRDTAEEYVLFPKNIGTHLSIDETCLSHDELYTIVTNKAFRAQFRGVRDIPFFIFRLAKIFA